MSLFARKVKLTYIILISILAALLFGFGACSGENNNEVAIDTQQDDIYVITDRFFEQQMASIFNNHEDYLGRTIRYEGFIMAWHWPPIERDLYFVVRLSEDCCGGNPPIGLKMQVDDISDFYDGAWVEVTGVFETVDVPELGEAMSLNDVTMRAVPAS